MTAGTVVLSSMSALDMGSSGAVITPRSSFRFTEFHTNSAVRCIHDLQFDTIQTCLITNN